MKKFTFIILLSVAFFNANSQAGQWVWVNGTNVQGDLGTYGPQGMAGASYVPTATYESCQWTDLNGNFWLFGGMDINGDRNSDLWKYNPGTNMWTWVNGPGTVGNAGVFGTQGVASALNYPPSVSHGTSTWTDLQGNLWLFGGFDGFGSYNDLWKYTISTNEWEWVNGPGFPGSGGIYGNLGVPNASNIPEDRAECAATWVDASGNLWLFGGENATFGGMENDLWRYNIGTNEWTWMKGSNFQGATGVYGVKGTENAANTPAARGAYTHWQDSNGDFWLFGGVDFTNDIAYNDLWRYNPTTGNWAWISGTSGQNDFGNYGTKCTVANPNTPPSRFEARACWKDLNGNFWMFGGFYNDPAFTEVSNDLWEYCVTQNKWIWESNDNVIDPSGSWGIKGVSNATNKPDGRGGSVSWIDNAGHLYLWGGASVNFPDPYNDMWKYTIDPVCSACSAVVLPIANFESSDSSLCVNDCITFTNLSQNSTSWQWTFQGGLPPTSTDQNPFVCYLSAGNFDVTLVASNNNGASDSLHVTQMIGVLVSPNVPTITQHGDSLFCSTDPSYTGYQWYDSATLVQGAIDTFFIATHNGQYNVSVKNANGCSVAVGIIVVINGIPYYSSPDGISIFPNPAVGLVTVGIPTNLTSGSAIISLVNALGQKVYESHIAGSKAEIDISGFASGIYFLNVASGNNRWVSKIVKE